MIGIDVSPLLLERRRGVARGLLALLRGFAHIERPLPVALLAPRAVTDADGLPALDGCFVAEPEARTARSFRRRLPGLVRESGATVFVAPWLAAPRVPVPTIVHVHELPFVRLGPIEGRRRAFRQRVWLRRHARRGAHFVVPSASTKGDLLSLLPDVAARVHVIAHGFEPAPWRDARREPDDEPYVVVVGTGRDAAGAAKKGIDLLPDVTARLNGRLAVRVLGDEDVSDADVRAAVSGARALLYPSRSEGFGFPPLEAMAAGVPVVTTDAGSIPEVVGEAALCVSAGDAAALADAALTAAFDEPTRERLIATGEARADAFPCTRAAEAWATLCLEQEGAA